MQQFTVTHPVELIEALRSHVGYPTRTKARNALKREEILVSGRVALRGSDILEPGTEVSVLSKEEVGKQKRSGGARPKGKERQHNAAELRAPFPVVYEDEHVFIYEKPAGWVCACLLYTSDAADE